MFGTSHSWAVTMRSLAENFIRLNNKVYIESTNGDSLVDDSLKKFFRKTTSPDIDICYTLPRNFQHRFLKSSKKKLAIYNYETDVMPQEWKSSVNYVDYVLPSSNFSKKIFIKNGWPEKKCIVIPHGINLEDFKDKRKANNILNNKKFRFLNVSIPHYRKNIEILVDAYYSAFSHKDDVCLVLKTTLKPPNPNHPFECDVTKEILKAQKKHKGKMLPQIEIIEHRYDTMTPLYNSCDCIVSASSSEGFGLPLLEALASNMVVVAPNFSGHLDFLNKNNSILYDVKMGNAPNRYQYWRQSKNATTSFPLKDSLASAMLNAYKNKDSLIKSFSGNMKETVNKFTWEQAAKKILEIQ
tara:strand:+ start:2515 stop:3576 length:1062 start_codon:yes stop_codon:yes gene_type:complete